MVARGRLRRRAHDCPWSSALWRLKRAEGGMEIVECTVLPCAISSYVVVDRSCTCREALAELGTACHCALLELPWEACGFVREEPWSLSVMPFDIAARYHWSEITSSINSIVIPQIASFIFHNQFEQLLGSKLHTHQPRRHHAAPSASIQSQSILPDPFSGLFSLH